MHHAKLIKHLPKVSSSTQNVGIGIKAIGYTKILCCPRHKLTKATRDLILAPPTVER